MRELNRAEIEQVSGSGWIKFLIPLAIGFAVIGFAVGGPAGLVYAAGGLIAAAGATNLEYLHEHNQIPTITHTVNHT